MPDCEVTETAALHVPGRTIRQRMKDCRGHSSGSGGMAGWQGGGSAGRQRADGSAWQVREAVIAATAKCQKALWVLFISGLLLSAMLWASRRCLGWLLRDSTHLSTASGWQRVFKPQLQPFFEVFYAQVWGMPPRVAAAKAAEAAAYHAKLISYKEVMSAMLATLGSAALFFLCHCGAGALSSPTLGLCEPCSPCHGSPCLPPSSLFWSPPARRCPCPLPLHFPPHEPLLPLSTSLQQFYTAAGQGQQKGPMCVGGRGAQRWVGAQGAA